MRHRILCRLGSHEGRAAASLDAGTVTYRCRWCDYTETDTLPPGLLRELEIQTEEPL